MYALNEMEMISDVVLLNLVFINLFNVYECFTYMYVCAYICVCIIHGGQKSASYLLELELGAVVSHLVGARN